MNGTLSHNLRRSLRPALEQSQGVVGMYQHGTSVVRLTAIPSPPDWIVEEDKGINLEFHTDIAFCVFADAWRATGFNEPEQGDRFTVTLADGVERTYALLIVSGLRPWSLDATGTNYVLRMKWVNS